MMGWTAAVTVAAALAALMIGLVAWLRADMRDLRADVAALGERVDSGSASLRERMAHLEGLLEGLRDAIVGRQAA